MTHFVHAVGWLPSALPELAKLEAPLREMLEVCLKGTKRTRRVASRRMIAAVEWTDKRRTAWEAVRSRIAHAVPMYHPKKEYRVLMFTDASGLFWGGCVTQVPEKEF